MDWNNYYLNQSNEVPFFQGELHQKGYGFVNYQKGGGLGGYFKKLFKYSLPIFKEHFFPVLKNLGKSVIRGSTNFASDVVDGKNIKNSARDRFNETIDDLNNNPNMTGNGIGSILNTPLNKKKKKILSIIKEKSKIKKKKKINSFDSNKFFGKKKKQRKSDIFDKI
jgi:hypothetical protein